MESFPDFKVSLSTCGLCMCAGFLMSFHLFRIMIAILTSIFLSYHCLFYGGKHFYLLCSRKFDTRMNEKLTVSIKSILNTQSTVSDCKFASGHNSCFSFHCSTQSFSFLCHIFIFPLLTSTDFFSPCCLPFLSTFVC